MAAPRSEQLREAANQLLIDERQELIMRAVEAQGVVYSSSFKLEWADEAADQSYLLRGFRVPEGYMAFSMFRQDTELEHSELQFNEKSPRIRIFGPIKHEVIGTPRWQRQVFLGTLVHSVLGNMIAEGYSARLEQ